MNKRISVYMLAESAVMLALAAVLSFISVYRLPYGGSITLCSMVPILFLSYRYETKWCLFIAFLYGLLQMLFGFYPPPTRTFIAFVCVIALDYLVAFGVLGLAGLFSRPFTGIGGMIFGVSIAILGRFLCHFASGIIIWGVYAPEGQTAAMYSFLYNGSFMLGEWILSTVAIVALQKVLPKKYQGKLV